MISRVMKDAAELTHLPICLSNKFTIDGNVRAACSCQRCFFCRGLVSQYANVKAVINSICVAAECLMSFDVEKMNVDRVLVFYLFRICSDFDVIERDMLLLIVAG